jgi:predicted Zn-dependent protease
VSVSPLRLQTVYFDGRQARAQPVEIYIADGQLHVEGTPMPLDVPVAQVRWAERQRHGQRLSELPGGGQLSHADGPAWDEWARRSGLAEPVVVRWMQSWRAVLAALLASVALVGASWAWGLPWMAQALVALVSPELERQLGEQALTRFDASGLAPSRLSAPRQAAIRDRLRAAVGRAWPDDAPAWQLHFRDASAQKIGANAFALPGGQLVLTDEIVALLDDQPDLIIGVLGHELGHVKHRHGLRLLAQAGLLGALSSALVGDTSGLLASGSALLGQQAYSRDFERQADLAALHLLRANGLAPDRMLVMFERLAAQRKPGTVDLPIALASHPADTERKQLFQGASQAPEFGPPH